MTLRNDRPRKARHLWGALSCSTLAMIAACTAGPDPAQLGAAGRGASPLPARTPTAVPGEIAGSGGLSGGVSDNGSTNGNASGSPSGSGQNGSPGPGQSPGAEQTPTPGPSPTPTFFTATMPPPPPPDPTPTPKPAAATAVQVVPDSMTLYAPAPDGSNLPEYPTSATLSAVVTYADGATDSAVTWSSSNTGVVTVSQAGAVNIPVGAPAGTAQIRATSTRTLNSTGVATIFVERHAQLDLGIQ